MNKTDNLKKRIPEILIFGEILGICVILFSLTYGNGVEWDQSYTWWMVTKHGYREICHITAEDIHPPLYYFILKSWMQIFGRSLHVAEVFSVLPVMLSLVLVGILGKQLWGAKTVLLLNPAIALSPTLMYHNVDIRMYSWMLFFVLGSVLFGTKLVRNNGKAFWILFCLMGIGGVYTQYFSFLPIFVMYMWMGILFLKRKDRRSLVRLFASAGVSVIAYLPWLRIMAETLVRTEPKTASEREYLFPWVFVNSAFSTDHLYQAGLFAGIMFFICLLLWILNRKAYTKEENAFLVMLVCNITFSFLGVNLIGLLNGHGFSNRYFNYVVVMIWWIMIMVLPRLGRVMTAIFAIWCILLFSAEYHSVYEYKYEYAPLMPKTEELIEAKFKEDDILVYDIPDWGEIIYGYYLDGYEWMFCDDVDLSQMKGKTLWIFRKYTPFYSREEQERYHLKTEHYYNLGFKGVITFDLEKVEVGE